MIYYYGGTFDPITKAHNELYFQNGNDYIEKEIALCKLLFTKRKEVS